MKLFFTSLEEYFGNLDQSDIWFFENIIETYCKKRVNFESNLELYKKLYEISLLNLLWEKEKFLSLNFEKTFGVDVLFNKENLIAYIR